MVSRLPTKQIWRDIWGHTRELHPRLRGRAMQRHCCSLACRVKTVKMSINFEAQRIAYCGHLFIVSRAASKFDTQHCGVVEGSLTFE